MNKIVIAILIAFSFTGCTFAQFADGYKMAKVVYKGAKYVVYEVEEEKKRIAEKGFGEK